MPAYLDDFAAGFLAPPALSDLPPASPTGGGCGSDAPPLHWAIHGSSGDGPASAPPPASFGAFDAFGVLAAVLDLVADFAGVLDAYAQK